MGSKWDLHSYTTKATFPARYLLGKRCGEFSTRKKIFYGKKVFDKNKYLDKNDVGPKPDRKILDRNYL